MVGGRGGDGTQLLEVFWPKLPCTKNCDISAKISVIFFIFCGWFSKVLAIAAILTFLADVSSTTCSIIPVQSEPDTGAWSLWDSLQE